MGYPNVYSGRTEEERDKKALPSWNDRRPTPPAIKQKAPKEKITPRMSQDAASHIGDEIASKILGEGGLSGATDAAHRKLIKKARKQGWKG